MQSYQDFTQTVLSSVEHVGSTFTRPESGISSHGRFVDPLQSALR